LKKICLLTPGHISTDPRLIKEAITLSNAGFKVHVIFTQYISYLLPIDEKILKDNPNWTFDCLNWIGNTPISKLKRIYNGLNQKLFIYLFKKKKLTDLAQLLNRNYSWQFSKAKKTNADLYIAHNLGALPIAINAARKNNKKCAFDAEDFHRNEDSNDHNSLYVKLKIATEEAYIDQLDYMTASSPLIVNQYSLLFKQKPVAILNVFPKIAPFEFIDNNTGPLKLLWFSQTVGPNRGLEELVDAIKVSLVPVELNLVGNFVGDFKRHIIRESSIITNLTLQLLPNVSPEKIFEIAVNCDIGVAAEPNYPLNRDICLTNKLFTYIQSGLAVLASATTAQKAFYEDYNKIGKVYRNSLELSKILVYYHNNRNILFDTKKANYQIGQTDLNWENESIKFLAIIHKTLS
jgi:hypothetical protein